MKYVIILEKTGDFMKKFYKIGEISKLYNISSDILRYYEKIGLITPDMRGENGYRYYLSLIHI